MKRNVDLVAREKYFLLVILFLIYESLSFVYVFFKSFSIFILTYLFYTLFNFSPKSVKVHRFLTGLKKIFFK